MRTCSALAGFSVPLYLGPVLASRVPSCRRQAAWCCRQERPRLARWCPRARRRRRHPCPWSPLWPRCRATGCRCLLHRIRLPGRPKLGRSMRAKGWRLAHPERTCHCAARTGQTAASRPSRRLRLRWRRARRPGLGPLRRPPLRPAVHRRPRSRLRLRQPRTCPPWRRRARRWRFRLARRVPRLRQWKRVLLGIEALGLRARLSWWAPACVPRFWHVAMVCPLTAWRVRLPRTLRRQPGRSRRVVVTPVGRRKPPPMPSGLQRLSNRGPRAVLRATCRRRRPWSRPRPQRLASPSPPRWRLPLPLCGLRRRPAATCGGPRSPRRRRLPRCSLTFASTVAQPCRLGRRRRAALTSRSGPRLRRQHHPGRKRRSMPRRCPRGRGSCPVLSWSTVAQPCRLGRRRRAALTSRSGPRLRHQHHPGRKRRSRSRRCPRRRGSCPVLSWTGGRCLLTHAKRWRLPARRHPLHLRPLPSSSSSARR